MAHLIALIGVIGGLGGLLVIVIGQAKGRRRSANPVWQTAASESKSLSMSLSSLGQRDWIGHPSPGGC